MKKMNPESFAALNTTDCFAIEYPRFVFQLVILKHGTLAIVHCQENSHPKLSVDTGGGHAYGIYNFSCTMLMKIIRIG